MSTSLTVQQKVTGIRDLLEKSKAQIAMALPKHCTPERMLRVTMTAVQRNPALLDCDPRSLIGCVVEASQLGLEPDGVLGHAYLVPFRNKKTGRTECQLIPGYKGLVELSRRSGQISTVYAKVVHAKDKYRIAYGLEPKLEHVPADTDDPGEVTAAYAVCRLRDGGVQYEWMWRREIEAIRKRSRAGTSGPWVTDYEEMCKKTVLRRLCKMLPVSVEVQRLVAADEQFDAGVLDVSSAPVDLTLTAEKPSSTLDALADRLEAHEAASEEVSEPDNEAIGEPQLADDDGSHAAPEMTEELAILDQYRDVIAEADTILELGEWREHARENAGLSDAAKETVAGWIAKREAEIRAKRGPRSNGGGKAKLFETQPSATEVGL